MSILHGHGSPGSPPPLPSPWLFGILRAAMLIDEDNFKLLRVNDELIELCKWLNEQHDLATSSRFIPLVDRLTHILLETNEHGLH
jgi:hypothetical protein